MKGDGQGFEPVLKNGQKFQQQSSFYLELLPNLC